ncbi:DUF3098 family protein [Anseongella ginsenosidimutans]|uniref:DUF3098 family protein n=1 Tax=Anseongella ginsenosidimutans TaxID=496056 RepID=A0A4R3KS49_9SPHI|nr:DUF3098 domain-containing protein [Anseongella ginsenosidimutans]QEC52596.1 DUF3098 domain-containing protein [Anseongella ginsenosidimutans]TCS86515.1 DUF3098 family protein [Anseongella ginsenosidimutans]
MSKKTTPPAESQTTGLLFNRKNYRLMLIGLAVTILGFALMYGKTDIYDFRKTVLAPIVVLAGFAVQFFAILKK